MSESVMPADRLMNTPEVAVYLGMKESWVRDVWRRQGIPFRRLGGQLRVKRSDLDAWYENQPTA